jgi:hypothetical protein
MLGQQIVDDERGEVEREGRDEWMKRMVAGNKSKRNLSRSGTVVSAFLIRSSMARPTNSLRSF